MAPSTDIVIPVHGAMQFTKNCIEQVLQHTPSLNKLILVDDFSDEETAAYLRTVLEQRPSTLLIRTGKQKWFTRASNLGLRLVRTEWAVLLNSDCELNVGWLDDLYNVTIEFGQENPGRRLGLVGHHYSPEHHLKWQETKEPNYVTGHCVLFNMQAISEVSAHRNTHGYYLDETRHDALHINSDRYMCYELNRLGMATVVAYKAAVGHHGFKSWGANLAQVFSVQLKDID